MNTDPRPHDPLDPRDPAADPRVNYGDPRVTNRIDARSGGSRAGLALAAIVAALLVVGLIAFSGSSVDETPTASTGEQGVIVPGEDAGQPAQPQEMAPATPEPDAPAAVPPQENPPAASE